MPHILFGTLGTTWQIVPELYGFTNPAALDLYRHHPLREQLARRRNSEGIAPVGEIWLVTTSGERTGETLAKLMEWADCLPAENRPKLKIWRLDGVEDLSDERECARMREAVFRIVLHASEYCDAGGLLISLGGGRKTMSSDVQQAAQLFGCRALIHVIEKGGAEGRRLRERKPADFIQPLPADTAAAVVPLIMGRYRRNPILDITAAGRIPVAAANWPIKMPADGRPIRASIESTGLVDDIRQRQEKADALFIHYTLQLIEGDESANFLALYSLPPATLDRIKKIYLGLTREKGESEQVFLKKLPKADLHCHLGGVADVHEMIEIAAASRELIAKYADPMKTWLGDWHRRLQTEDPQNLHNRLKSKTIRNAVEGVPEPLCVSAFVLLFEDDPALLEQVVYGPWLKDAEFCGVTFNRYEALGDLQGSGLLQNRENLQAACRILLRKAKAHNVAYLELRCSPVNYTRGGLDAEAVVDIIRRELARESTVSVGLIFIASRHSRMSIVYQHVELAEKLLDGSGGFPLLRGFDLAGNEEMRQAIKMRESLMSMMERCLHFTIHAGETADVQSIWEAVYHLNAERVGHGLKLKDNPDLLERFRDRRIAVEMCPSSNFQIVGFRDNYYPQSAGLPVYPLKQYLDQGLRVTVNTDNPGISRTDFSAELLRAARLTPGGLSLWDTCRIIRNGFKAAFAGHADRSNLLRQAENRIVYLLTHHLHALTNTTH